MSIEDVLGYGAPNLGWMFGGFSLPPTANMIILLLSGVTGFFLSKSTSGAKSVTFPVCFSCLFIAAIMANMLAAGISITGFSELQRSLIFAIAGQCVMGIILLGTFRTASVAD
jgi:hypothetical protein